MSIAPPPWLSPPRCQGGVFLYKGTAWMNVTTIINIINVTSGTARMYDWCRQARPLVCDGQLGANCRRYGAHNASDETIGGDDNALYMFFSKMVLASTSLGVWFILEPIVVDKVRKMPSDVTIGGGDDVFNMLFFKMVQASTSLVMS